MSWREQHARKTVRRCNTPQHAATRCNTLHRTALHFSKRLIQFVTDKHCSVTHCNTLKHAAAHCNTLQHAATHCNTLQHTATHCNTLQHTATHSLALERAARAQDREESVWQQVEILKIQYATQFSIQFNTYYFAISICFIKMTIDLTLENFCVWHQRQDFEIQCKFKKQAFILQNQNLAQIGRASCRERV